MGRGSTVQYSAPRNPMVFYALTLPPYGPHMPQGLAPLMAPLLLEAHNSLEILRGREGAYIKWGTHSGSGVESARESYS